MYGSMFSELSTHVGKLIVKLDKRLIPIFKDLHPDITFIGNGDNYLMMISIMIYPLKYRFFHKKS